MDKLSHNLAEVGTDMISRQAAIDAIHRIQTIISYNKKKIIFRSEAADVIKSLPSAQPMRPKGKWIPAFDGKFTGGAYWYNCNQCNHIVPGGLQSGKYFCEGCGADMREVTT